MKLCSRKLHKIITHEYLFIDSNVPLYYENKVMMFNGHSLSKYLITVYVRGLNPVYDPVIKFSLDIVSIGEFIKTGMTETWEFLQ